METIQNGSISALPKQLTTIKQVQESDESEKEVVDELIVDPNLQNWVYNDVFLQQFEFLNTSLTENKVQILKIDKIIQQLSQQQELIENLQANINKKIKIYDKR